MMYAVRMKSSFQIIVFIVLVCSLLYVPSIAQDQIQYKDFSQQWIMLQLLPSCSWVKLQEQTHFAFEWEISPLIYSFGMNPLDPPWHFLQVTQPERFAGSIELDVTSQMYFTRIGSTHWGFSGQLLMHLPLVERGEYVGLNLGVARYTLAGSASTYIVGGFSTIFGFIHYNIKYSPADKIWMNSIELRFF